MEQQIPFSAGSYLVESAFLVTPAGRAISLADATIEVFQSGAGTRQMQGKAFVLNIMMVELMEDEDRIDLLLDLGHGFRYLLKEPKVNAGKVFHPTTRSILRFSPTGPLIPVSDQDYSEQIKQLQLLES